MTQHILTYAQHTVAHVCNKLLFHFDQRLITQTHLILAIWTDVALNTQKGEAVVVGRRRSRGRQSKAVYLGYFSYEKLRRESAEPSADMGFHVNSFR